MQSKKDIIFITIAIIIGLIFKQFYAISSTHHLLFILSPVNMLIELFFGLKSSYDAATGFYFESLNIVIDKSCAGVNFWIVAFWAAVSIWVRQNKYLKYKSLIFIGLLVLTYIFTIFANASRIAIAIIALQLKDTITLFSKPWFHEAEGAFVYLFFLLLFSLGLNYLLNKTNHPDAQRA